MVLYMYTCIHIRTYVHTCVYVSHDVSGELAQPMVGAKNILSPPRPDGGAHIGDITPRGGPKVSCPRQGPIEEPTQAISPPEAS